MVPQFKECGQAVVAVFLVIWVSLFFGTYQASADPGHYFVNPTNVTISVDCPTDDKWIIGEVIDISRKDKYGNGNEHGNPGNGRNDPLKYSALIPAELKGLVYLRINGQESLPLGNEKITVVKNGEDHAALEFLLDPRIIWQNAGEYTVLLEPNGNKAPTIELVIIVRKYARIKSVPDIVTIEATDGPGRYFSKHVQFVVEANHSHWKLDLIADDLQHEDSETSAVVKPSELLMALVTNEDVGEFVPFASEDRWTATVGRVINPRDCTRRGKDYTTTACFAVDVGWHHLAGIYSGRIHVTLVEKN
ncbi:MAG: hypothetical protein GX205_06935 [Firmicutes bacterium]|nr:hypothetical protein [Bacillota bacterium]